MAETEDEPGTKQAIHKTGEASKNDQSKKKCVCELTQLLRGSVQPPNDISSVTIGLPTFKRSSPTEIKKSFKTLCLPYGCIA